MSDKKEDSKALVIIKGTDYGIKKTQEKELLSGLPQIQKERDAMIPQYDRIIKLDIDDPKTALRAKEVRLMIAQGRTQGLNPWHKAAKDYFLQGGKFCDAVKNRELAIYVRMEENLKAIETHQVDKKIKRLKELHEKRFVELSKYMTVPAGRNLSVMEIDVYDAFLKVTKDSFKAAQELEKQKALDKIQKDKDAEIERKRLADDNLKLRQEKDKADAKQKKIDDEREAKQKVIDDNNKKELAAKEVERKRLAKIVKDKDDAEAERLRLIEKKIQDDLNKGDAAKVTDLINDLNALKTKFTFKSNANKLKYRNVSGLIDKVTAYIKQ